MVRLGEQADQPGAVIVNVAQVSTPADDRTTPIPQSQVVIHVQAAGRHGPFDQRPDEMHWNESAAELSHLRPAGRSLQPLAVVKLRIPIIDRSMVAAEGNL